MSPEQPSLEESSEIEQEKDIRTILDDEEENAFCINLQALALEVVNLLKREIQLENERQGYW